MLQEEDQAVQLNCLYSLPNEETDLNYLTEYLMPTATPSRPLSFILRVNLNGNAAAALLDTGAGLSFLSTSFAAKHKFTVNQLDADECFDVRLGNGTTVPVNQFVSDVGLHLKSDNFRQKFYLLGLPTGLDCIIGMDFLTENDAWVHPKSKRILFDLGGDTSTNKSVEVMAVEQFLLEEKISHLEKLPTCGVVDVDDGSGNDYEFVNDKVMKKLLLLMRENRLDWDSYTSPELRGKPVTADDKVLAARIAEERKWSLPRSAEKQAAEKTAFKQATKPKLVLVLHKDLWQPALMGAKQHDHQRYTVKLLRSGESIAAKRGHVSCFRYGKLNRHINNDHDLSWIENKNKVDKPKEQHCKCCGQFGGKRMSSRRHNFCPQCHERISAAPEQISEIFAAPKTAQKEDKEHTNDPGLNTMDTESTKEEEDHRLDAILCNLTAVSTAEYEEMDLDEHPAFEEPADKSTHGKYAGLKTKMDEKFYALHMMAAVEKNKETWRLFALEAKIDESNVEDYIRQQYPIDIDEIGKTAPHWQAFVDKMIAQEIEHFTCFDKLERWAPLPHHPRLRLRTKPNAVPALVHRHRVPIHLRDVLRQFHEDLYRRGFIEPIEDAEHLSPVVLVKKPDNADGTSRGFRMVVNMQARNATLESIANRIPDTNEVFQRLKHAKLLSVCDLSNGYWNVGLDEHSKRLTAFGSEQSQWVWRCLPQGMVSSGPYFQMWVERLFRRHNILAGSENFADLDREFDLQKSKQKQAASNTSLNDSIESNDHNKGSDDYSKLNPKGAKVALWKHDGFLDQYLDDSLISSELEDEQVDDSGKMVPGHRQHVLQFLRVCSAENLPLAPKKCHFFCKYIRHLGIVCGQGTLMCDPDKVATAVHIERPDTKSKLRKFLGAVGWFRMWIANFAQMQCPLNELLKGEEPDKKKFKAGAWTDRHEQAFIALKKSLIMFPVLTNFDPKLPTEIVCDASETHIGGALLQRPPPDADGKIHPPVVIAYHSRALIKAEKAYSAQEREMLACYSCSKKFRHYLMGAHFTIRILNDHRSLQLVKLSKVAANRVGRWNMHMSEFDFTITYLRGEDNHLADQLSRAVQLPADAFDEATGFGFDNEDNFEMPFAYAWPVIAKQVINHSNLDELKLMHMLKEDSLKRSRTQTDQGSAAYCAAVDHARAETFSTRTDLGESADNPEKLWTRHEMAIFGLSEVTFRVDATFTESQYLTCPDFGPMYRFLKDQAPDAEKKAMKRALKLQKNLSKKAAALMPMTRSQQQKSELGDEQKTAGQPDNATDDVHSGTDDKNDDQAALDNDNDIEKGKTDSKSTARRRRKQTLKQLAASAHRFHIDGGFLYFDSPSDGVVICVPEGISTDSMNTVRTDDDTDESYEHKCRMTLRERITDELHSAPMSGHRGYHATVEAIRKRYHWPQMRSDVRDRIAGCSKCAMSKIDRTKPQGKMVPVELPSAPGQSFNLDLMVDLPEVQMNGVILSKVLVAVDRFSKRVYLMECPKHATAPMLAQIFVDKVLLDGGNGACLNIVSDRDALMTSSFWQSLFKRLGSTLSMSASRSQQTNGAAERIIAVVEEILRTRIDWRQQTWPDLLPHVAFAINQMARMELQGKSSLFIERGVDPVLPVDLLRALRKKPTDTQPADSKAETLAADRIKEIQRMREQLILELHAAQDRQKANYDARRREVSELLKPGAKAWLKLDSVEFEAIKLKGSNRRKKLNPLFYGPFEIDEQCGPNSFRLKLPQEKIDSGLHPVFHTKNLKASAPDPTYEGKFIDIPDSAIAETEYEITKIMAHRKKYGRNEFLVHYKGFSELRGEFTEEAELRRNASEMLDEYMKRHHIETDGIGEFDKYVDSSDGEAQDETSDSSPPRKRKQSKSSSRPIKKAAAAKGSRRSSRGVKRKK